jgi:peroxin-12
LRAPRWCCSSMMSAQPVFPSPAAPPSHLRPSLFELLAQEQLRDLLHPVVRYVLSVGTQFSIQRSSLK